MASGAGTKVGRKLSLKGRALALLAQRDHSTAELRRKLLRYAQADAAGGGDAAGSNEAAETAAADVAAVARVDAVIDWLCAHRYLSEERYIETRVHARSGRYGNLRIKQELAQHGLSLPAPVAQALKDSELERAGEVWRRKFGAAPADGAQRARQARFLAQRGFSPEVVARLLRRAGRSEDPADDD